MNLTHFQIAFLRHLAMRGATEKDASASAEFFNAQHGLGRRAGSTFIYTQDDADQAAQMLSNRHIAVIPSEQVLRRTDAVLNNLGNEKSGTLSPHQDSVAIKTAHGQCLLEGDPVPLIGYQVVTFAQAQSVRADAMLVVENLESFRFLERNRWIDYQGKSVLAIFRGDNSLRADAALKVIESRADPVWAYFDFDPAGLGMASRLPRLVRLLLPPEPFLSALARRANQVHLFSDQMAQWAPTLNADDREIFKAPWRHMQRMCMGLAQEHMDSICLGKLPPTLDLFDEAVRKKLDAALGRLEGAYSPDAIKPILTSVLTQLLSSEEGRALLREALISVGSSSAEPSTR